MTVMNSEVYEALMEAGASDAKAKAAAHAVMQNVVTTEYLDLRLAELRGNLKAELIAWMAGMLVAQTAVIAALVKLL